MHCPCVRVAQDQNRRQEPLLVSYSRLPFPLSGCFNIGRSFLYSILLVMVNPISIHVLEDTIILQGSQQESAGKLLQGKLILDLKEPIKVRSVNLRFYGKMKVSWREGKSPRIYK